MHVRRSSGERERGLLEFLWTHLVPTVRVVRPVERQLLLETKINSHFLVHIDAH